MPVSAQNDAERRAAKVLEVANNSTGTDVTLLAAALTETATTVVATGASSPTLERELLDMMTETQ
jgi:hypothetical protein